MSDWKDKLRSSEFNKGGGNKMKKICENCKKEFEPREPHHKTCSDCNKKKYQGTSGLDKPKIKLPDNYLGDSYFDDKGYLKESIFKKDAKVVVNALAAENMTPTALRAFYNKLKAIENRYKISNNDFDLIKPSLYAFERDVAYQVSRGVVRDEFRKFININAELAIRGPKEFKGFIEHFLSVLAYFKDITNR